MTPAQIWMQLIATARGARRWFGLAAFGFALSVSDGLAQTLQPPPPRFSNVDANGVDVLDGAVVFGVDLLSIGPEVGGLSLRYTFRLGLTGGWRHNHAGAVNGIGSLPVTVSIGMASEEFIEGPVNVFQASGTGSTLVFNATAQTYSYTTSTGMVGVFSAALANTDPFYQANRARLTQVTYQSGERETYHYRAVSGSPIRSVLQSVTNNFGYQLHFEYGTGFLPIHVQAINNAVDYCDPVAPTCAVTGWPTAHFNESPAGQTTISDALGRTTTVTLYVSQNALGIRRPSSPSSDNVRYTFGTDNRGNPRVVTVTDFVGTWSYDFVMPNDTDELLLLNVIGPMQNVVASYEAQRRLLRASAGGASETYEYDQFDRLFRVTQSEGDSVTATYDGRGNVTTLRSAAKPSAGLPDLVTTASYSATCGNPLICNKPTSVADPRGAVTNFTYDPTHGGVLTVTRPAPALGAVRPQTRYSYMAQSAWYRTSASTNRVAGSPVYVLTQASACATSAACANQGEERVAGIGYQVGASGTGSNLLPLTRTVRSGNSAIVSTTSYSYDSSGNRLTLDGPLPGAVDTTRFRFDVARQLIGEIDPDPDGAGSLPHFATRLLYNLDGRIIARQQGNVASQSDADWNAFTPQLQDTMQYDSRGLRVREDRIGGGATLAVTQWSYDNGRRLDCTSRRQNTAAFGSLPSACSLSVLGSFGADRITRNGYNSADQLISMTEGYGTGAATIARRMSYTPNGRLDWVQDANGNRSDYSYDGLDRVARINFPQPTLGAQAPNPNDYEQYGYDAAGNRVSVRLRSGEVIAYSFDALNREVMKDVPSGTANDVYTAYDLLDRRLAARFGSTSGQGVVYAYDAAGRLLSETNTLGASRALSFQYDAASNRTRVTWPNGFFVQYTYDNLNRVDLVRENGAATLADYAYDPLSRRVSLTRGNGSVTSYGYDNASRLSSLAHDLEAASAVNDQSFAFAYTPANQLSQRTAANDNYNWTSAAVTNRAYVANGRNQYASVAGVAYGHDARGNLSSNGSRNFTYDLENRLVSASGPTPISLIYDPLGRLFQVGTASTTTQFLYDGDRLVAEYNGSSTTPLRRYVHGPSGDEPLVWYEGSGTTDRRYLIADHQGSIIAENGAATLRYSYGPYGEPNTWPGTRFRYTGQIALPEANLYHYKARVYDPVLGRFLQTDPVGYRDDMNLYAYVANDPLNRIDPTGLENCPDEDPFCYETPETEGQPGEPPPPSESEEEMDEIVVTAERDDEGDLTGDNETFYEVEDGLKTPRTMTTQVVTCSDGREITVGLPGSLGPGQMGLHSHGDELEQAPGPRDDSAARRSSDSVAGVFTRSRSFTIRSFPDGTFRVRQRSGSPLSAVERSALVDNMRNWEQNNTPGQTLVQRVCGN